MPTTAAITNRNTQSFNSSWFVFALAVIVLLSFGGLFSTRLAQHQHDDSVMRVASGQPLLAQMMSRDSLEIEYATSVAQRAKWIEDLKRRISALNKVNRQLVGNSDQPITDSAQLVRLQAVQPSFQALSLASAALLSATSSWEVADCAGKLRIAERAFTTGMTHWLAETTKETVQWQAGLITCIWLMVGLAITIVICVNRFIWQPQVNRARQIGEQMGALQLEATAQNQTFLGSNQRLEHEKHEIENRRNELELQADQLKSITEVSQAAARRFEDLFQGMPVGCVGFDAEGTMFEYNQASFDIFGFAAYEVLQQSVWDQRFGVLDARAGSVLLKRVFRGHTLRDVEWEYRRPTGELRNILCSVFPLRGTEGKIIAAIAACQDISERVRAERAVKESEQFFRTMIDSLHEGLVVQDANSAIVLANSRAAPILGLTTAQLLGRDSMDPRWQAIHADGSPFPANDHPALRALATGLTIEGELMGVPTPVGDTRWLTVNAVPLFRTVPEKPDGVLVSFNDVTQTHLQAQQLAVQAVAAAEANEELQAQQIELQEACRQLEALAVTDGLTGLYNHRAFQERLVCIFKETPLDELSIILCDVDHFKSFNDTYGHPAGDEVLRAVACLLKERMPKGCLVARYGGEEFVVILPGFTAEEAQMVAEKLRASIEHFVWPMRSITLSLGVATAGLDCLEPAVLIKQSDLALYGAKHGGRNRSVHFSDLEKEQHAA